MEIYYLTILTIQIEYKESFNRSRWLIVECKEQNNSQRPYGFHGIFSHTLWLETRVRSGNSIPLWAYT